jgi:hypothetical protein
MPVTIQYPPLEVEAEPSSGICASHADIRAVATCARCGTFVCAECREFYDYQPLCKRCYPARSHSLPASSRAKWALVLGLLGLLVVVIPFGVVAVILAHGELAAIKSGEAPAGGLGYARAGALLGWLANVMLVLVLFLIAIFAVALSAM